MTEDQLPVNVPIQGWSQEGAQFLHNSSGLLAVFREKRVHNHKTCKDKIPRGSLHSACLILLLFIYLKCIKTVRLPICWFTAQMPIRVGLDQQKVKG